MFTRTYLALRVAAGQHPPAHQVTARIVITSLF